MQQVQGDCDDCLPVAPWLASSMAYDPIGRQTAITDPLGRTNSTTYDRVGSRTSRTKNGVATTWSYDLAQRLTEQAALGAYATLVMDEVGNVAVKQHQGGAPQTYMFDPADRITTMLEGSGVTTYAFDPNGNNTVEQTNTRLTTNTWDPENRLTGIQWKQKSSSGLSTYTFSGDGLRRTAQEQGAGVSTMIWDGSDYLGEVR